MNPSDASSRVAALRGLPSLSLVGWQVDTEPGTRFQERWTIAADLPSGLVDEQRVLYLRSDSTGEVISTSLAGLEGSLITSGSLWEHLRLVLTIERDA